MKLCLVGLAAVAALSVGCGGFLRPAAPAASTTTLTSAPLSSDLALDYTDPWGETYTAPLDRSDPYGEASSPLTPAIELKDVASTRE